MTDIVEHGDADRVRPRRRWPAPAIALVVIGALAVYGIARHVSAASTAPWRDPRPHAAVWLAPTGTIEGTPTSVTVRLVLGTMRRDAVAVTGVAATFPHAAFSGAALDTARSVAGSRWPAAFRRPVPVREGGDSALRLTFAIPPGWCGAPGHAALRLRVRYHGHTEALRFTLPVGPHGIVIGGLPTGLPECGFG